MSCVDEGITGDALPYLDPQALQDLGIEKMGHRLAICKAIYNLKVELTRAAVEADPEDGLVGWEWSEDCLLYTSDAADERAFV